MSVDGVEVACGAPSSLMGEPGVLLAEQSVDQALDPAVHAAYVGTPVVEEEAVEEVALDQALQSGYVATLGAACGLAGQARLPGLVVGVASWLFEPDGEGDSPGGG